MLFSYNPAFMKEADLEEAGRSLTSRRLEILDHLRETCIAAGIDEADIVYLPSMGQTYVGESRSLVTRYLNAQLERRRLADLEGPILVLSDMGNAFKSDDGLFSVISSFDHLMTEQYPPDIHHFLSPNDNNYFGYAKAKWRSSGVSREDDVLCSLQLMMDLNEVPAEQISDWFKRNFFMNGDEVSLADCEEICSKGLSGAILRDDFLLACFSAYTKFMHGSTMRGMDIPSIIPESLATELDGEYWSLFINQ